MKISVFGSMVTSCDAFQRAFDSQLEASMRACERAERQLERTKTALKSSRARRQIDEQIIADALTNESPWAQLQAQGCVELCLGGRS